MLTPKLPKGIAHPKMKHFYHLLTLLFVETPEILVCLIYSELAGAASFSLLQRRTETQIGSLVFQKMQKMTLRRQLIQLVQRILCDLKPKDIPSGQKVAFIPCKQVVCVSCRGDDLDTFSAS